MMPRVTSHALSRMVVVALSDRRDAETELKDAARVLIEIELKDGKPPTEFRVFKAGENTSTKGNFFFTEASQSACMAYQSKRNMPTLVDYEHASRYATFASDPAKAGRAAAWCKLECRDQELWATGVKWTPAALKAIEEKEFRFFSPVFFHDRETMVIGECTSIGLTNTPALDNLTPLAAKDDGKTPETHDMEELKKFLASLAGPMMLKSDASAAEVALSVSQLVEERTKVLALAECKTLPEALGTIAGWKQNSAQVVELRSKLAGIEQAAKAAAKSALIEAALKDQKITPAQRPMLETMEEAQLKSFLDTIAPKTATGTAVVTPPPPAGNGVPVPAAVAVAALKDEDRAVAKMLGFNSAEALANLATVKSGGIIEAPKKS